MREMNLNATVRAEFGKHTRALRRTGKVPGIFYRHGEKNIPITIEEKSLKPLIYTTETHIINLQLGDGKTENCILRDLQLDPVSERPVHFDLQGLREDEEITLEIPITVVGGTSVGVREGGILQQVIHKLRISCLPRHIPDHVEVNPENLKINQFIHVRDLKIDNVKILESENSSVIGIVPPTVEKEPEPSTAAVEEPAEPEVIGKGKKPEEGEEGEAAAEKKVEGAAKQPAAPAKGAPAGPAKAAAPAKPAAPAKEEKEKK